MDNKILNQNKIPGSCDTYTRPEEISALSKFLGQKKNQLDESLVIEDSLLGIPGKDTGLVPDVNSLSGKVEDLDIARAEQVNKLNDKLIALDSPNNSDLNIPTLPSNSIGLKDEGDLVLPNEKQSLVGKDELELSNEVEILGIEDNISLVESKEELTIDQSISLSDKVESIEHNTINSLGDDKVVLSTENNINLSDKSIEIENNSSIALGESKVGLEITKNVDLSDKSIELKNEPLVNLTSDLVSLKTKDEVELSEESIELVDNNLPSLGNSKVDLFTKGEIELGDKSIEINNKDIDSLSSDQVKITDNDKIELGSIKKEILDNLSLVLGKDIESLDISELSDLGNTLINLTSDSGINLEDVLVKLEHLENTSLGETTIELLSESNEELSSVFKTLIDSGKIDLSKTKETLLTEEVTSLGKNLSSLEDPTVLSIKPGIINIKHEDITSLSKDTSIISNQTELNLSNNFEKIEDNSDTELDPKKLDLKDSTRVELQTTFFDLDIPESENLSNDSIGLNILDSIENLGDELVSITGTEDDLGLSDLLQTLDDITVVKLSEELLNLTEDNEIDKLGNQIETIQEKSISSIGKEKLIIPTQKAPTPDNKYVGTIENLGDDKTILGSGISPKGQKDYKGSVENINRTEKEGLKNHTNSDSETKKVVSNSNTLKNIESVREGSSEGNLGLDLWSAISPKKQDDYNYFAGDEGDKLYPFRGPGSSDIIPPNHDLTVQKAEMEDFITSPGKVITPKDPEKTVVPSIDDLVVGEKNQGNLVFLNDLVGETSKPSKEKKNNYYYTPTRDKKEGEDLDVDSIKEYSEDRIIYLDDTAESTSNSESETRKVIGSSGTLKNIESSRKVDSGSTLGLSLWDSISPEVQDDYNYFDSRKEDISSLTEEELYKMIMEFNLHKTHEYRVNPETGKRELVLVGKSAENTNASEWIKKVQSFASSFLNIPDNAKLSGSSAIENYENALNSTVKTLLAVSNSRKDMPGYKLPESNIDFDVNNYLRYIAERTVGLTNLKGSARRILLAETLGLLIWGRDEAWKLAKAERHRLPGDTGLISDIMSDDINYKNITKAVTSNLAEALFIDTTKPINRPEFDKSTGRTVTKGWKSGNTDPTISVPSKDNNFGGLKDFLFGNTGDTGYSFAGNYLKGKGIETTLLELAGTGISDIRIGTVEGFFDLLKSSPYLTTAGKVSSSGEYKVSTLDSNAHWEIVFEPYMGYLNGWTTFLPMIDEINDRNEKLHGIKTKYSEWIPINSFELQKEKISTRTLGLYDGEVTYPTSIEFTNEFRMTIVDDQYKSWRTYFERVMQVSVYSSSPNTTTSYSSGWTNTKTGVNGVTVIDRNYQVVAPYKNLAFRCKIFVMTPQLSTITKYDLLLVLKDFSEERSGEIDSSGSDLNLSFSIVGENPPVPLGIDLSNIGGTTSANMKKLEETRKNSKKQGNLASSLLKHGTSSIIGLIK